MNDQQRDKYCTRLLIGFATQNILLQNHRLDTLGVGELTDCRHDLAHLSLLGLPGGTQLFEVLKYYFSKNVDLISQLDFRSTESPDIPAEEFDYPSSKKKNKICMFLSGSFLLVFILTLIAFSLIF